MSAGTASAKKIRIEGVAIYARRRSGKIAAQAGRV
jgi:hypothetical protein